jgi:hypothetical protein
MMHMDVEDDTEPMEEGNTEDAKVQDVTKRVKNLGPPKDDLSD